MPGYLREVDDVFTLAVGKEFEVQADAMDELAKLSRINWERADVVDPTWKPGAPMPAASIFMHTSFTWPFSFTSSSSCPAKRGGSFQAKRHLRLLA